MKHQDNERISNEPLTAAERWWARRQLDEPRAREEMRFRRWLEIPENAKAWSQLEDVVEKFDRYAEMPEIVALRTEALAMLPQRGDVSRFRTAFWMRRFGVALAASVAALIFFWTPETDSHLNRGLENPQQVEKFATRVGENRTLQLPDGSVMKLNTGSIAEVQYTPERRNIRLLTGQAFFSVAKNAARPFVVSAGSRRITATGTSFDVRLEENGGLVVLLVEGKVFVEPIQQNSSQQSDPHMAGEELAPGEKLVVPRIGPLKVVNADVELGLSWQSGVLIFRDEPLSEAIAELNRYSVTKLVSSDPRALSLRVSGVFKIGNNENFIAAITSFHPVYAVRPSPDVVELKWK